MPAFLIENFPAALHEHLRRRAKQHGRSMSREVIAILERALATAPELSSPVELSRNVDADWVVRIIRHARELRP